MLFRRCAWRVSRQCTRYASSPALAAADDMVVPDVVAKSRARNATVGALVGAAVSSGFVKSLAETYVAPLVGADTVTKLHAEIAYWLGRSDYEALADFLLKLTSSSAWTQHLAPAELAYIMGKLAVHQAALNRRLAAAKNTRDDTEIIDRRAADARAFRTKYRNVYSNVLFGTSRVSVYDRSLRRDLYGGEHRTGYVLSVQDYQNLIAFEYNNFKLDLAAKWFERFERQHGLRRMTKDMWTLRFKVFGRGDTKLWGSFHNELYDKTTDLVLGYAQQKTVGALLKEYLQHHSDVDHDMLATVIHCLGHGRNTEQLYGLIHDKWGIDQNGKQTKSVAAAPTLDVLSAIVVVLSHNQEYFQAMVYVNSFQDHFGVELSGKQAIPFWIELFKASDLTTRFNPRLALRYYIEKYNPTVPFDKLDKLQQNVDFDYEAFLTFEQQLRNKRTNIMTAMWKLYNTTHNTFAVDCVRIYAKFVAESPTESDLFTLLAYIGEKYRAYHVTDTSFNAQRLNNTARGLYRLYINTMIAGIKLKCSQGFDGQCRFLIDEWSIDEAMKDKLHILFTTRLLPACRAKLDARRKQLMIEQRQEDRFLDLL